MEGADLRSIPNYLTAQTPQGLRRLMLRNNVKHGMRFTYHDIQFVDGVWFAWFYLKTDERGLSDVNTNGAGEA